MLRQESGGMAVYTFEALPGTRVVHAVFTRHGGVSLGDFATLNVGKSVGDEPAAVAENQRRVYDYLGLTGDRVTTAYQVHGNRVAVVGSTEMGCTFASTDGQITQTPGAALFLRFADCQPILLYDAENHALAVVHAGWRGVAQAIVVRAVESMAESFGTNPAALFAGLGPAIGRCCYTVGDDVAAAMGYALPDWREVMTRDGEAWRFDLPAANGQQLASVGVQRIEQADLCTACRTDEFYSHRAEKGHTGRFATVAYLEDIGAQEKRRAVVKRKQRPPVEATPAASLEPPGLPRLGDLKEEA